MITKKQFFILLVLLFIVVIYFVTSQEHTIKDNLNPELTSKVHSENKNKNLSTNPIKTNMTHKNKVITLTLENLLLKINKKEKVNPDELFISLKDIFNSLPEKQHLSLTLKMVPLLIYLDKNYQEYREIIGELYTDINTPDLLRLPMLQIMGRNFDDKSKVLIESVFSNYESESEWLLGESALVLAKHDIDISDELMTRYDSIGAVEKSFYAQSLALLDAKEALSMIKESIPQMQNVKAKSSLLQSYAKLSSNSSVAQDAIDTLLSIANDVDIKKKNSIKNEIYSMQAVMALGSMNSDNAFMSLLKVAQKEDALPSTRIAALESLTQADQDLLNLMQVELKQLAVEVDNTQLIDTIDKQRIQKRIQPLIK